MSPPASAAHSTLSTASAPPRNCRLVLLGAGHAQVQVLHGLARERPAHLHITLVAPHARQAFELGRDDGGEEVAAVAVDFKVAAGQAGGDVVAHLRGRGVGHGGCGLQPSSVWLTMTLVAMP